MSHWRFGEVKSGSGGEKERRTTFGVLSIHFYGKGLANRVDAIV
jgi:hypothetical protein